MQALSNHTTCPSGALDLGVPETPKSYILLRQQYGYWLADFGHSQQYTRWKASVSHLTVLKSVRRDWPGYIVTIDRGQLSLPLDHLTDLPK